MAPKEPGDDLDKLGKQLEDFKGKTARHERSGAEINRDAGIAGLGWRISIELVVGIIVGMGIGYFLDRWFATKPLFMVVFMFLGFAAGILNVVRLSARIQRQLQKGAEKNEREV